MKILVIHGPNLPLLGKVSARTGTRLTLDKVNSSLRKKARELGVEINIFQFYDERHMLKAISTHRNDMDGLLLSPGALSRSCFALRELLAIVSIPTVELHLMDLPFAAESFADSVLKDIIQQRFILPGPEAYPKALEQLVAGLPIQNPHQKK